MSSDTELNAALKKLKVEQEKVFDKIVFEDSKFVSYLDGSNYSPSRIYYRRWTSDDKEYLGIIHGLVEQSGSWSTWVFYADKDVDLGGESHPHCEITVIKSGKARFTVKIDNQIKIINLKAGDVIKIPEGVWHRMEAMSRTKGVMIFFTATTCKESKLVEVINGHY